MERSIGWLKHETLSEDEHRHALAHQLGVPFVTLTRDDLNTDALVLVPEPVARQYNIVAYRLDDSTLEVALLNLEDLQHTDFLRSRYKILPRFTSRESLVGALLHYQKHLYKTYGQQLERGDSPNLLETLLRHALAANATDIHLHSGADGLSVRYRINGALREAMTLPPATGTGVIGALRTLSGLSKSSLPREARVRVDLKDPSTSLGINEQVGVRVASVPVVDGEKMTLHITRESLRRGFTLESLGLHGEPLEQVHAALLKRRGLIVVSGGPQSGKTTLLYTMLDMLNAPEVSMATVENQVAHTFARVAQTDLGATGLSAAAALRAALRSDCDIVMIDSIVDSETAALAAAAAERGVLVLAAVEDEELLPDAALVVRTALVRKLCTKHFADKAKLTRAQSEALEQKGADFGVVLAALKEEGKVAKDTAWKEVQFARAAGCSECDRGYKGLLGLQEVRERGASLEKRPVGTLNMIEDGLYKAAQGLTTIDEIANL